MLEVKSIVRFGTDCYGGTEHYLFIGVDGLYEMTSHWHLEQVDDSKYETVVKRQPIIKLECVTDDIYLANFNQPIWNKQQYKWEERNHYWVKLPLTGEWVCTNRLANAKRLAAGNSGFSVTHGRCIPAVAF